MVEKDRMIKVLQKESLNCASFFRARFVDMTSYTDRLEEQLKLSREKEKDLASELSVMKENYASLECTVGGLGVDMMELASDVGRLERNRDRHEEQIEKLEDALVDTHLAAKNKEEFLKERLSRSWSELCTALECLAVAEAKLSKFFCLECSSSVIFSWLGVSLLSNQCDKVAVR